MKKIMILLMITSGLLLANENMSTEGCKKTEISIFETIYSCPSGDYLASYEKVKKERLDGGYEKSLIKLGDIKPENK